MQPELRWPHFPLTFAPPGLFPLSCSAVAFVVCEHWLLAGGGWREPSERRLSGDQSRRLSASAWPNQPAHQPLLPTTNLSHRLWRADSYHYRAVVITGAARSTKCTRAAEKVSGHTANRCVSRASLARLLPSGCLPVAHVSRLHCWCSVHLISFSLPLLLLLTLLVCLSFMWFIVGQIWTFRSRAEACPRTLFRAAMWIVLVTYVVTALQCCLSVLRACCNPRILPV